MLSANDTALLWKAAVAVLMVVVLIARLKLHPFLALVICALGLGLAGGLPVKQVLGAFGKGFGETLANVGTVLALGAMFGALLGASRGAERVADALVGMRGPRFAPWAMAFLAMLLGLPMFFETGLVMMMPIIVSVGLKLKDDPGRHPAASPYLLAGLPALAGLSVLHGLVPPHPGPLIAISALHADLGMTLALGLIIAVPTVILAGPVFTMWAARHARAEPPMEADARAAPDAGRPLPGAALTILTILFPIGLMLAKAAVDLALPADSPLHLAADFLGAPVVALLLGTLLAMATFGRFLQRGSEGVAQLLGDSLGPIAAIVLVIGAGGALKQTLIELGLGATMGRVAEVAHVTPLLLGWGTAVLIRVATGSATVATITAAGLMAGNGATGGGVAASLLVLAIGSGSLFFSHVNDAGFWLVKGVLGIDLPDMFKTWSTMETIVSVTGLALVLGLSLVLPG